MTSVTFRRRLQQLGDTRRVLPFASRFAEARAKYGPLDNGPDPARLRDDAAAMATEFRRALGA